MNYSWVVAAVAGWTAAIVMAVVSLFSLGPIDQDSLSRYPAADSEQNGPVFDIVCTAYSNRPEETMNPPYDKHFIGFRVVSDCVTVEKP